MWQLTWKFCSILHFWRQDDTVCVLGMYFIQFIRIFVEFFMKYYGYELVLRSLLAHNLNKQNFENLKKVFSWFCKWNFENYQVVTKSKSHKFSKLGEHADIWKKSRDSYFQIHQSDDLIFFKKSELYESHNKWKQIESQSDSWNKKGPKYRSVS